MKTKTMWQVYSQRLRLMRLADELIDRLGGATAINLNSTFEDGSLYRRKTQLLKRKELIQQIFVVYVNNQVAYGANLLNDIQVPLEIYTKQPQL